MKQHESDARKALIQILMPAAFAPGPVRGQKFAFPVPDGGAVLPFAQALFVKLQKDPFAVRFIGREPVCRLARQGRHDLLAGNAEIQLLLRIDARKAIGCDHFSQARHKHGFRENRLEAARRGLRRKLKHGAWRGLPCAGKDLPFRQFYVFIFSFCLPGFTPLVFCLNSLCYFVIGIIRKEGDHVVIFQVGNHAWFSIVKTAPAFAYAPDQLCFRIGQGQDTDRLRKPEIGGAKIHEMQGFFAAFGINLAQMRVQPLALQF